MKSSCSFISVNRVVGYRNYESGLLLKLVNVIEKKMIGELSKIYQKKTKKGVRRRFYNHPTKKLSKTDIEKIRKLRATGELVKSIADEFNVSSAIVSLYTRDLSEKRTRSDSKERT